MKKTLLLAPLLSLGFLTAQAQISKGTALIGGFGSYSQSNEERTSTNSAIPSALRNTKSSSNSLSVNPSVGFFVAENIALGLTLGVSKSKYTSPSYSYDEPTPSLYKSVSKTADLTVASFLRYYYLPTENFGFYGQLTGGYFSGWSRTKTNRPDTSNTPYKSRGNGFYAGFTPVLVFFPTTKLGLELAAGGINYNNSRFRSENSATSQASDEIKRSGFGANFGLSNLTLGASYYIGRQ